MAVDHSFNLGELLAAEESTLQGTGVDIGGYGGGSPDGPVWQYEFSRTWELPWDTASVRVCLSWISYMGSESNTISVTRFAEIYRQGQLSSFTDVAEQIISVESLLDRGLVSFLSPHFAEGERLIYATNPE